MYSLLISVVCREMVVAQVLRRNTQKKKEHCRKMNIPHNQIFIVIFNGNISPLLIGSGNNFNTFLSSIII